MSLFKIVVWRQVLLEQCSLVRTNLALLLLTLDGLASISAAWFFFFAGDLAFLSTTLFAFFLEAPFAGGSFGSGFVCTDGSIVSTLTRFPDGVSADVVVVADEPTSLARFNRRLIFRTFVVHVNG